MLYKYATLGGNGDNGGETEVEFFGLMEDSEGSKVWSQGLSVAP